MTTLEPGKHRSDWQTTPRFAPLADESVPVTPSRIARMPTLGAFTVARLAGRLKKRLLSRLREGRASEDGEP